MRQVSSLATCFILALTLAACSSDEDGGSQEQQLPVTLESGSLDDAEPCDANDPECPEGTICAVVRLEGGDTDPSCVSENICDEVTCDDNAQCAVGESFPYQIFCSGTCSGSDCDDPTQS
jgi:hypothetical protein